MQVRHLAIIQDTQKQSWPRLMTQTSLPIWRVMRRASHVCITVIWPSTPGPAAEAVLQVDQEVRRAAALLQPTSCLRSRENCCGFECHDHVSSRIGVVLDQGFPTQGGHICLPSAQARRQAQQPKQHRTPQHLHRLPQRCPDSQCPQQLPRKLIRKLLHRDTQKTSQRLPQRSLESSCVSGSTVLTTRPW